eukprot:gene9416-11154_t
MAGVRLTESTWGQHSWCVFARQRLVMPSEVGASAGAVPRGERPASRLGASPFVRSVTQLPGAFRRFPPKRAPTSVEVVARRKNPKSKGSAKTHAERKASTSKQEQRGGPDDDTLSHASPIGAFIDSSCNRYVDSFLAALEGNSGADRDDVGDGNCNFLSSLENSLKAQAEATEAVSELSALNEAISLETDFSIASRAMLGEVGYSPHEQELLRFVAEAMGFGDDIDECVAKLSRAYGENPQRVRTTLLLAAKQLSRRFPDLPDTLTRDVEPNNQTPEGDPPTPSPVTPSVSGLPSNPEVDAYHQHCAEIARQISGELYCDLGCGSPFGRETSGAGLEELSRISLEELLPEGLAPVTGHKLLLTVVLPAYKAASIMAVVADHTGQRVRLAVYGTDAGSEEEAQRLLPVGARFALRNPLLKRCQDHWLGLRVDYPEDLVRLDPPLTGRVLVLGDGDFSFSAALARLNAAPEPGGGGPPARITATSLDSRGDVLGKYCGAEGNLESLGLDPNVEVWHGVDATQLSELGAQLQDEELWRCVIWNFPYPVLPRGRGAGSVLASYAAGGELLRQFLRSVDAVLAPGGEVRVTLAAKQGGTTREAAASLPGWNAEEAAAEVGFDLWEVIPFDAAWYNGYEPRREFADTTFPSNNAHVHIFRRAARRPLDADPGAARQPLDDVDPLASSGRHLLGTVLSFMRGLPEQLAKSLTPVRRPIHALEGPNPALVEAARTSSTARALLAAAESFEAALHELSQPIIDIDAAKVAHLLEKTYVTPHGELTAIWPWQNGVVLNKRATEALNLVVWECLVRALYPQAPAAWYAREAPAELYDLRALLQLAAEDQVAARGRMQGGTWLAPRMTVEEVDTLAGHLVVMASLMADDVDEASEVLSAGIAMGINDARVWRRRGELRCFLANRQDAWRGGENGSLLRGIVDDCDRVLEVLPADPTAIYTKAFALKSAGREQYAQAVDLYEQYLELVEPDDRMRPAAHYHAGILLCALGGADGAGAAPSSQEPRRQREPVDLRETMAQVHQRKRRALKQRQREAQDAQGSDQAAQRAELQQQFKARWQELKERQSEAREQGEELTAELERLRHLEKSIGEVKRQMQEAEGLETDARQAQLKRVRQEAREQELRAEYGKRLKQEEESLAQRMHAGYSEKERGHNRRLLKWKHKTKLEKALTKERQSWLPREQGEELTVKLTVELEGLRQQWADLENSIREVKRQMQEAEGLETDARQAQLKRARQEAREQELRAEYGKRLKQAEESLAQRMHVGYSEKERGHKRQLLKAKHKTKLEKALTKERQSWLQWEEQLQVTLEEKSAELAQVHSQQLQKLREQQLHSERQHHKALQKLKQAEAESGGAHTMAQAKLVDWGQHAWKDEEQTLEQQKVQIQMEINAHIDMQEKAGALEFKLLQASARLREEEAEQLQQQQQTFETVPCAEEHTL